MPLILFDAEPFSKGDVTLALESGVDGLIVPQEHQQEVSSLARTVVLSSKDVVRFTLKSKDDEAAAAQALHKGALVMLEAGWEVIPVENLLAQVDLLERIAAKTPEADQKKDAAVSTGPQNLASASLQGMAAGPLQGLAVEVRDITEARLASGILERGVDIVILKPAAVGELKAVVAALKYTVGKLELDTAEVTEVTAVGMGHRVCVDTLSIFKKGQGMLAGNSAAFTFLVHAETESNEYVASRPFRINAGGAHSYTLLPGDHTCYLEEIKPGDEVLIVNYKGECELATAGRIKTERRPMLLIRARAKSGAEGAVFLQNAETIRLVSPEGQPISVVDLKPGDTVLCRLDAAGRHFGVRIQEEILEQ